MLRKQNKKGFTLAELLIVVAIIAVLVAIAVPLFVGALDKAEDAVLEANERSLKGMAITQIMTTDKYLYVTKDGKIDKNTPNKSWKVKGQYIEESDTFKILEITASESALELDKDSEKSTKTDTGYDLWVVISASELTVG